VSWFDQILDIPRTRDASLNWAADTDSVGPVTPELVLVDPGLAHGGEIRTELRMSSMQFGDGTVFNTAEPSAPVEAQHAAPLQPVQPLVPPPVATPEVAAPVAAPAPPAAPAPAPADVPAAIAVADMRDVPLGTLVFRAGLLPEERLEEALQEGMKTGKRLGEILLERGWVSETDLGRLLAGQKGLPFVELDPSAIDPTAPPLLHPEKARLHGALPIGFEGGVPVVAVADPSNDLVIENVRRALACEPVLVVAGRDALLRTINEAYGLVASEAAAPAPAAVVEPTPVAPVVEAPPAPQPVTQAAPAVEPVIAQVVEPLVPVVPVIQVAAVEPEIVEPVGPQVPVAPEPVAAEPVAPAPVVEPVVEPVAVQPHDDGAGVWLGQAEPTPEPAVPVQPVTPVVVPEPVVPQPVAAPEAVVTPEPVVAPEPQPAAPAPAPEPVAVPQADVSWAVFLRLADGERLEVGAFRDQDEAFEGARAVVGQIGADGSWPFFAGRFIRPESIVSVDLVELEVTRWLGSQARAAALSPDQQPSV
jgi:hypothetical protein